MDEELLAQNQDDVYLSKLSAEIKEYKEKTNSSIKVIFNVFKDQDEEIYRELLR